MLSQNSLLKIANAARTAAGIGLFATPLTTFAQAPEGDAATIAALREQVTALTRRLDEIERRQAAQAPVKPDKAAEKSVDPAVYAELREARAAAKEARAAAEALRGLEPADESLEAGLAALGRCKK